jgi:hypothetical protein
MKKSIFVIGFLVFLLIASATIVITACTERHEEKQAVVETTEVSNPQESSVEQHGTIFLQIECDSDANFKRGPGAVPIYIVVDKETRVQYIQFSGGDTKVRIDQEGKPLLYEGDL